MVLTIRAAQLTEFSKLARSGFIDRMLAHWKRCFPELYIGTEECALRDLAESGIERAALYGIASERSVCHFLDLWLILSPGFDNKYDWAAGALGSPHLGPSQKVSFLRACARDLWSTLEKRA